MLGIHSIIFSSQNHLDVANTLDSKNFTIRKENFVLKPQDPFYLKFTINYNEIERKPNVQNVILNGENICDNHFDRRDLVVLAVQK